MFFKLSIKILFVLAEIIFGFYSIVLSDSLLVKFIFFLLTAVLVAFLITRLVNKVLPADKDYISSEQENAE
ncbi:MAG: hypothetical protein WBV11_01740 [Salegentibacter sp.]